MEYERKELINKLNNMGVSHARGKNPHTMPINELKELIKYLEKRISKKYRILNKEWNKCLKTLRK